MLKYLPGEATIHVKVFPVIKLRPNNFVSDTESDPAIFLAVNPKTSQQKFENTVSHEMHHIGLASTDKLYERKVASLPPGAQKAALLDGSFR